MEELKKRLPEGKWSVEEFEKAHKKAIEENKRALRLIDFLYEKECPLCKTMNNEIYDWRCEYCGASLE